MSNKKLAMSITTWMCVPEFGMKDLEVLCRGSAFLVPARAWNGDKTISKPKYHVLTCSHVVAPWRWPKLYPDEWLRHINEKHTHYTVEMRHDDGVFVNQGDLHPKVYHHGSRDLAALHIELEQDITELYMSLQLETELSLLSEKSSYYPLSPGQNVTFHGHDVVAPFGDTAKNLAAADGSTDYANEEVFDRLVVPTVMAGTVMGRTKKQIFTSTGTRVLPIGMCGGPVVIPRIFDKFDWAPVADAVNSSSNSANTGAGGATPVGGKKHRGVPVKLSNPTAARVAGLRAKHENPTSAQEEPVEDENKMKFGKSEHIVVGLLEGIVPLDHPVQELRGSAVFVEGPDIIKFLKEVEAGEVVPVVGGEAAERVGRDQDPEKMNLKDL